MKIGQVVNHAASSEAAVIVAIDNRTECQTHSDCAGRSDSCELRNLATSYTVSTAFGVYVEITPEEITQPTTRS
jgi:hypothetical protein